MPVLPVGGYEVAADLIKAAAPSALPKRLSLADIVEKVLFPGWQKNLSVTVRQFKYLAGGTANCSASPCMTLQTAPTGEAASILTVIGISPRMWPTYFFDFFNGIGTNRASRNPQVPIGLAFRLAVITFDVV